MVSTQTDSRLQPLDDLERTRIALYRLYMSAIRQGELVEELGDDEQEEAPTRAGKLEVEANDEEEDNGGKPMSTSSV